MRGQRIGGHASSVMGALLLNLNNASAACSSKCNLRAEHRGASLATQLLAAPIEAAATPGSIARVSAVNTRAQAFYLEHGFAPVGHKDFVVGMQTVRNVVMERTRDLKYRATDPRNLMLAAPARPGRHR